MIAFVEALPSANNGRVAILAIVIVISWRLVVRRALAHLHRLESNVLKFLSNDDGSSMLDCSDENLLEAITQSALRRGNSVLQKTNTISKGISTGASFYHANSSNGDSSESSNSSFNERDDTMLPKPQQMTQQVGGVSNHKSPVLTWEPHYVLKPLRLSHICHNIDVNDFRDGLKDKTKVYRGVREIAFYEVLAFASRLSHLIASSTGEAIGYNVLSHHHNIFSSSALLYPDTCVSNGGIWSIVRGIKDVCSSTDSWNRLAFLAAHHAGDEVVMSAFKSYMDKCSTLVTLMDALSKMSVFTADYYGVVDLQSIDANEHLPSTTASLSHPHLVLGNITSNFRRPNIIDLKMGTQAYEPSAPDLKKKREIQKYTKQAEFGLRIVGMRVYDKTIDDYICKGKSFGTGLMTKDHVIEALRMFLCSDGDPTAADGILRQLTVIKDWFENSNSEIAIYAGSILIVYEGDATLSATLEPPAVKMIDFAHVCRKQGGDEGYLKGIKTLMAALDEIRRTMLLQHDPQSK